MYTRVQYAIRGIVMDYLTKLTGINVTYQNEENNFPHYILSRYLIKNVRLDNIDVFFLYPKSELDQINAIVKHISKIQQYNNKPAVLILNKLTSRERSYLLRERVPFIVNEKQIYLPFMAMYIQEKCDAPKIECDKLLPSAQQLLLSYIYNNSRALYLSEAVKTLTLTSTSVMRAANQLVEIGLFKTKKIGVQRIIYCDSNMKELFKEAQKYLFSPVKKVIFVDRKSVPDELLLSGYSALANYTMLNEPNIPCYAVNKEYTTFTGVSRKLMDSRSQCKIEIWRYNPDVLTLNNCVDELSLYLSLMSDEDERVEEALEILLDNVWERLDGNRN